MAIRLTSMSETFEVALFQDDALDMKREEYLAYLKTCDKSLLVTRELKTPTYFVMKKVLRYEDAKKTKPKFSYSTKGDTVEIDNSFSIEEVRLSLCGVNNSPDLPEAEHIKFKVENGGAPEEIMSFLIATGAVDDLYMAKQFATGQKKDADIKKN